MDEGVAMARLLAAEIREVLGADLVGLYLYGSTVAGDCIPGISDIDLVAVTRPPVDVLPLEGLGAMHRRFVAEHPAWVDRVEVVYVERHTLDTFRASDGPLAVIGPGEAFHVRDDLPRDWVQNWYLARETGVVLVGEPPAAVFPVMAWSEFVTATVRYTREVRDRDRRHASPGAIAYAILTLCRALRTVTLGAPCSKEDGADWTARRHPAWARLINAAQACRQAGGRVGLDDGPSRLAADRLIVRLADEVMAAAAAPRST